jgi:hypothetical protein
LTTKLSSRITFDFDSSHSAAASLTAVSLTSSNLTEVTIPSSVTVLGKSCFWECSNLKKVTIPSSETVLGRGCFAGCSNLTEVTIPSSVTVLGDGCFVGCSNLTKVTIPSSVTVLGDGCFAVCSSLTEVTIPSSVTELPNDCFAECSNLTEVTIPSSVTVLGDNCFAECSNLLPPELSSIGADHGKVLAFLKEPPRPPPLPVGDNVPTVPTGNTSTPQPQDVVFGKGRAVTERTSNKRFPHKKRGSAFLTSLKHTQSPARDVDDDQTPLMVARKNDDERNDKDMVDIVEALTLEAQDDDDDDDDRTELDDRPVEIFDKADYDTLAMRQLLKEKKLSVEYLHFADKLFSPRVVGYIWRVSGR